jgi:hypothetical protein
MRPTALALLLAIVVAPIFPNLAWCSTELVVLYTADNDGFIDPCG